MTHLTLAEFVAEYDLDDTSVDELWCEGDLVHFTFALFHCDDPKRDDESKEYTLRVCFKREHVGLSGDSFERLVPQNWGEILAFEFDGAALKLGVLWKAGDTTQWTYVTLSGAPVSAQETVTDRRLP